MKLTGYQDSKETFVHQQFAGSARSKDQDNSTLAIIIPAYNESESIGKVLRHLIQFVFNEMTDGVEMILVDDASSDGTFELAKAIATKHSNCPIRIMRHPVNRGYGAALKTGILATTAEYICITDADGTYPNERIPELFKVVRTRKLDMIVGMRVGPQAHTPVIRKPAKWVLRWMVSHICDMPIPDFNSGLRLFRRNVALRMMPLLPDGFSFTTTITLAMATNNYSIGYEPIAYHSRVGRSKIRPIRDTLRFIKLILMMGLYFAPLKVFLPVATMLIGLSLLWGVTSWLVIGQVADVTTMLLFLSGLQVGSIGLLAELINHRVPSKFQS
jgi:glycosyltransferase involved in cell wall biosynthesis